MESYASNRTQSAAVSGGTSPDVNQHSDVSHGSVLGSKNRCAYTEPVGEMTSRHNVSHHCRVDDIRVYSALNRGEQQHAKL